ncbi:uncharacterized protein LOC106165312 [Lingula anatina]|uniref:Uncharacterized protein LOC106165312 n=1 Tax=Lingula anatina TaxID=7574 RepID=A0A1S3IN13_LINAN|nr:uncharacterized protein LOC106165312 [Lingula anatina]|eukprot:XP_013398929.1 uncharacterized protein LOC106165312 [Lingula anatina]
MRMRRWWILLIVLVALCAAISIVWMCGERLARLKAHLPLIGPAKSRELQKPLKASSALKYLGKPSQASVLNVKYETIKHPSVDTRKSLVNSKNDFIIVTASDKDSFNSLSNLVGSIHFWEPKTKIIIYDIGLDEKQRHQIRKWCMTSLVSFDFSRYPKHVKSLKQRVVKPIILKEVLETHHRVVWMDPEADVRGSLTVIREHLEKDLNFFLLDQDKDMRKRSHKGTFKYFHKKKKAFKAKSSFSELVSGWVKGSEAHRKILLTWERCARDINCVAPPGSNARNHRYTQTALSILTYSSRMRITTHNSLVAVQRYQLDRNPRNSSRRIINLGRQKSKDYITMICRKNETT